MAENSPDAAESGIDHRAAVRERYGSVAESDSCCCGPDGAAAQSERVGYDPADVASLAAANLGLGCGTPVDHADLAPGETVLDLGAGGGFDCFLAAREVGADGEVIGVDMTPEMVETARENAADFDPDDATTPRFRLGEIEHLPVADESIDAIVSNCVVNLSPDKPRVFAEAHRVLRPGGRLVIADVVRTADLPPGVEADRDALTGCVSGAESVDRLETMLRDAGFADVRIDPGGDDSFMREWSEERDPSDFVASAVVRGRKPTE